MGARQSFLVIALSIGLLAISAPGTGLADGTHYGSADPLTEGWSLEPGDDSVGGSAVASDPEFPGVAAWEIENVGGLHRYRLNGPIGGTSWTLASYLRVVDVNDPVDANVLLEVADGSRRWLTTFGSTATAATQVDFLDGGSHQQAASQSGVTDYLLVEVAFNPADGGAGEADVFVDGVEVESDWGGQAIALSRVNFGDGQTSGGGRARFAYVDFAGGPQACRDGIDNDGDGLVDFAGGDGGCSQPNDPSEDDVDRDGDGLDDLSEIAAATDLNDPDSDGDGLRDGFEVAHGFDPTGPDESAGDPDADGLTNLDEQAAGTDPQDPDSDGDGFEDGFEVGFGTDPAASTSNPIEERLLADDGGEGDQLGWGVSISGDTAVIGAPHHDSGPGTILGAVYVYTRSGGVWSQSQKLFENDDGSLHALFGLSVSLSGDTLVVGAPFSDDLFDIWGAAFVYTRSGGVWSQQQKLESGALEAGDDFGWSVAVEGDTILVGSRRDGADDSGSAYVFTRSGGAWSQQQKLVAGDAAANDGFGFSVALSGESALVGAIDGDSAIADSGSAYVFTRNGTLWTEQQEIVAADPAVGDLFGRSVALSGDTAIVGAYLDDDAGSGSGSAYVFTRSGGVWSQQQKLVAGDAAAGDSFGVSVALSSETAVIGAFEGDSAVADSGSAYVFTRNGTVWTEQQELVAADAAPGDSYGSTVAIDGDTVVAGAPFSDQLGADSGAAYVTDLDADDDGLSNVDEAAAGSDVLDPDSDDDGLSDGDEVHVHGTDPRFADTDGDGVDDGVEIAAGTDPLDSGRYPVTPTLVLISDPGNAADVTGFGAVATFFEMGTVEVSNRDYVAFLNAVADDDPHGLFNGTADPLYGVTRTGISGSYQYEAVPGREDQPVSFVSLYDAMRFVNWLHNGQPEGAQGPATTEDGAYTITPAGISANDIMLNPGASYSLPTEDEWYKAGHYDGAGPGYLDYPTGSSTAPSCAPPSATPDTANCHGVVEDTTDVGAYTGSASPNGTFDQGGNVWEWTDTIAGASRRIRGGSFGTLATTLAAANSGLDEDPITEAEDLGFRIVPEPGLLGGLLAGSIGIAIVAAGRRRRGGR